MPFWSRVLGAGARSRAPVAEEEKSSRALALAAVTGVGRAVWTPRDYGALAREGFARNPVVYRCIRMTAEAAASVPLTVHHGGRRADGSHPLQRLLDRPNPEQAGPDLFESFFGSLQFSGNGYLEAGLPDPSTSAQDGEGAPSELYALRPDRMQVIPGPNGWPEAWQYSVEDGRTVRIGRRADGFLPVLQLRLFNPNDDHYGASPLEAAAFAVDIHNASGQWNKALLDNAARPSGALVFAATREGGAKMTEEQFDRLKAELSSAHTGASAAGRPLLLEGGLDWKPMSMSPAEMDFIAGKHAAARDIALAFGVPPQLLGIPGDNTYSNYKEANAAFWRQTVVPLAERAARAITAWLGPLFPDAVIHCELDRVPALSAERDALWARLEGASFLSDEERRRLAGLGEAEPSGGGQ